MNKSEQKLRIIVTMISPKNIIFTHMYHFKIEFFHYLTTVINFMQEGEKRSYRLSAISYQLSVLGELRIPAVFLYNN